MYYCYVIYSDNFHKYYIGVTENVNHRLSGHNSGISKWTKGKGPWILVWQRKFSSLSEARKFENLLKRQKGGSGFYNLTGLSREGS